MATKKVFTKQEKAEQQKRQEFYEPDVEWTEEEEEDCDFDFGEECVEPHLKNMNCCFECWLFIEVDAANREHAKTDEESEEEKGES